ncbi:MAG TPA: HRDC domain-containing protein [Candidatus Eisenbacteria bacterium]|nr:HRDC domain-containing protein [Candidatus Eisenbacteria bacterium]
MRYVDTPAAVAEAARLTAEAAWSAIDTEADSLHHYVEKLCLVQITIPGEDIVGDPLAADLSPMVLPLQSKPLVMHGADFDIRMLKRAYGYFPVEVFDTMLAAQYLGYEKQGYADLVDRHCGVRLSKSSQKADWSKRPLTETMLDYAVNDTRHLHTLRTNMEAELRELGRLEWHRQHCRKLLKTLSAPEEAKGRDPEREWQMKGSKDLKGAALTVLREIWYWRDEEARRRDRPSFKVLNSEYLIEIARWAAENPGGDVGNMPKAPSNVRRELRDALNRVVRRAEAGPPAVWTNAPRPLERKRWTNEDEKRLLLLKAERQNLGAELKIHPSLIATNAVLEVVACKAPQDREALSALDCLMPWQQEVVAEKFLEITRKKQA